MEMVVDIKIKSLPADYFWKFPTKKETKLDNKDQKSKAKLSSGLQKTSIIPNKLIQQLSQSKQLIFNASILRQLMSFKRGENIHLKTSLSLYVYLI